MNISSDLEEAMTEVRRKLVLLQIKSSVLEKYYNLHTVFCNIMYGFIELYTIFEYELNLHQKNII